MNVETFLNPTALFRDELVLRHDSLVSRTSSQSVTQNFDAQELPDHAVGIPLGGNEPSESVFRVSTYRKVRYYDDEDYKNHRYLAYPHMHQPLKLMEPRALRRTHERVLSIPSATGSSVSQRSIEAGVFDDFLIGGPFTNPVDGMSSFTNTTSDPLHAVSNSPTASDVCILTDSALPGIDLPMNIAGHGSELTLGVPFANLHQLDPASPSLADGACVLGQAQKSRQFQMDSWSVLRATAPWKEFISDVTFDPSLFVESSHGGSTTDAFDFRFPARRPLRPRRRRSRGKPLNSMFQPSLARLSEEGSSVSSSPVSSSSVSVDNAETDGIPFSFVPASLLSSERRMVSSYLLAECLTRIGTQNDLPTLNRSNHNTAIDGQVEHLMDHSLCYYHPPDVRQLPMSLPVCSSSHLPVVSSSSCVTGTNSIVHDLILPIDRVSSMSSLQPMLSFRTVPSDFYVSVRFAIHEPSIVPSPLTSFCALPSATHTVSSSIVNAIFSGHTLDGESAMFPNLRAPLARPESVATPESFLPKGDDHNDVNVIKHAYDDATALSVLSLSDLEWKKLQQMKILSRYRTSGQVVSHSSSDTEEHRYMKPAFRRRRHRCLTVLSCVTSHPSRKRWRSGKFEEESKNVETEAQCTRVPVDLDAVVTTVNSIDLPDHTAALKPQKTYSQPVSTSLVSGAITSHIIGMASAVHCTSSGVFEPLGRGRSKGVKTVEGGISTQCLLRANGLVLDYLPPVFAELDVLTCASTEGTGSEGRHVPSDVSGIHPEASFYEFQWLEAARWVQYEEDFDPLTGDFGQAHSPLLMFHAVVECLRYLERGVVLLPFDSSVSRTSTESSDTVRVGEDYLFSIELEAALDSLLTHCDASLSEVALIRRVLQLHHMHKCELRQKQRSGRPLSYIRARCDSVTSESPQHGLRNVAVYDQPTGNHDSKSAHPNSRRSTHLSGLIDTPTSVTSIKNRAVSVLRRLSSAAHRHLCYTLATEGNHNSATCSTLHPCATDNQFSHPERVRTVGLVDIASKHASDLEGRLSPLTEVVSVHVGVLPGLRKPLFIFIRLYRPAYSSELTELHDAYPIRFVLLFLGPQQSNVDYCEVGRVLATMMVDRSFRKVAYSAADRTELLTGLRTFLDTTVVLPLLQDVTPRSLLAMHDQLRSLRRRQQLRQPHGKGDWGTDQPSGTEPLRTPDSFQLVRQSARVLRENSDKTVVNAFVHAPNSTCTHDDRILEAVAISRSKAFLLSESQMDPRHIAGDTAAGLITMETTTPTSAWPISLFGASNSVELNACSKAINCSTPPLSTTPGPITSPDCYCYSSLFFPCHTQTTKRCWSKCRWPLGLALCTDIVAYRHRILSDLTDPFRRGSGELGLILSTIFFVYFIVLAPTLTFGAIFESNISTDFSIPLCIFACGAAQCVFSSIGGQPLLIVGITGPILLLETCIKLIVESHQMKLSVMRLQIAIYTSFFGLLSVLANAGWLVLRVRRSVEEVFNFFVSFYFIFKAMRSLLEMFTSSPLPRASRVNGSFNSSINSIESSLNYSTGIFREDTGQHYAGFVATLLLALMMLTLCFWLQSIKRGRYFRRTVRNWFGYFNVPIGLACTVCVNQLLFPDIQVPTIRMENGSFWSSIIAPTVTHLFDPPEYGNPFLCPKFHGLAAAMALCLLTAIATETMLSGIRVAKSERRLRKPCLFSLDLAVTLCVLPMLSALCGWPFLSPAAVRSNTHVIALTKWNTKTAPGIPHRIVGCVEQRITGLTIGLLVAISIALEARLFTLVPLGALYGMFLYMGTMGLRDSVIVRRMCALLKRRKHWKDREYLRHLPPFIIAIFVTIQMTFVALLLVLNCVTEFAHVGATSLIFPFVLLAFAVVREQALTHCRVLRPFLEQLDRLHQLQLPSPVMWRQTCRTASAPNDERRVQMRWRSDSSAGHEIHKQRSDTLHCENSHTEPFAGQSTQCAWTMEDEETISLRSKMNNVHQRPNILQISGISKDPHLESGLQFRYNQSREPLDKKWSPHTTNISSLSDSSGCSESELESRMDNPYWLD